MILGLKTDTRMWQPDAVLNPMISGCLDALINSTDSLLDYLQAFARIVSISKENSLSSAARISWPRERDE